MNAPNQITVARICAVPGFVVLAYRDSDASALGAFAVFTIASLSDVADGYLARRDGGITRLGKFLDPLADKLLVGAALVVLVDTRAFPLWVALVIAGRELAVQVLRTRIVRSGGDLPASQAAKAKTTLQIAMVSWWLLPLEVSLVHWALVAAAAASTLWSGAEYFLRARVEEARAER